MTIRRVPEDFAVHEIAHEAWRLALAPTWSAATPHAVFELRKTSLTTPEATQRLAGALSLKGGGVAHAGLKDKHASTTQFVSAKLTQSAGGVPAPDSPDTALTGPGWSASLVGFSDSEIDASIIDRNAFTIVVRDLTRERNQSLNHNLRRLRDTRAAGSVPTSPPLLFINYFGEQRFGSARHGGGLAGPLLCKSDFEAALRLLVGTPARKDTGTRRTLTRACATHWGDWARILKETKPHAERRAIESLAAGKSFRDAFAALPAFVQQLAVEAYQSSLWNRVAARLARDAGLTPESGKATTADGVCETLLFPNTDTLAAAWRSLKLPMLSPEVELAGAWASAARAELAADGLALTDLRVPGLRRPAFGSAMRPMLAAATNVVIDDVIADEFNPKRLARTLRFDLPRGAYATVLLRALGE